MTCRLALIAAALVLLVTSSLCQPAVKNVVIVTIDGFRWQEIFTGMDTAIAHDRRFHQEDSAGIMARYWSDDPAERRAKLLPFLWGTVAKKGQIYGNRALGSYLETANPYWFSYPGYSELLCGYVDTAVNSNDYPANPNVTLLEFLSRREGFRASVAAFGAWDAFDRIINEGRSGIPVMSAFQPSGGADPTPREKLLNAMLKDSPAPWGAEECLDLFTFRAAMEELSTRHPRVLYVAFGETDEYAHAGQYASYLDAVHRNDAWLGELWAALSADPFYAGSTALVIAVDHGRGRGERWTSHGQKVPGANETWCAFLGAGVPARGEIAGGRTLFQRQIAQTIASLLGTVYVAAHPVADKIDLSGR
jgi:hypothetical protein